MTFLANYNLTKPKEENIRCVQCKKAFYDLGITEVTTLVGNIILKGGFLIAAMVDLDTRSTMDIDATIKDCL